MPLDDLLQATFVGPSGKKRLADVYTTTPLASTTKVYQTKFIFASKSYGDRCPPTQAMTTSTTSEVLLGATSLTQTRSKLKLKLTS